MFTQRIDAICKALDTTRTALGVDAGFSPETVRNWIAKAEAGKLRRTDALHKLARHYSTTVEWLLGESERDAPPVLTGVSLVPAVVASASSDASKARLDTKAMADAAVGMLVELDGVPRAVAAEKMLDVRLNGPPSIEAYYRAARLDGFRRATEADLTVTDGASSPRRSTLPPATKATAKRELAQARQKRNRI